MIEYDEYLDYFSLESPLPRPEIKTLVFLDLETTELPDTVGQENAQITELCFIAVDTEEFEKSDDGDDVRIVNKLNLMIKPRYQISPKAAEMTGLNNKSLQCQGEFDSSTAEMITLFLNRLNYPVCLLAHYGNTFDFKILKAELNRVGSRLSEYMYCADTLEGFRALLPNFTSYELENLYNHFFERNIPSAHCAESDCLALMKVAHKFKLFLPWIDERKQFFHSIKEYW